jgi:ketol-acid reductoisomerase
MEVRATLRLNNMKDSGLNVIVGLRPTSKFVAQAKEDGLDVYSIAEGLCKSRYYSYSSSR